MQVTFVRHTRVAVAPGLCYGSLDVPLHENYAEDLARLREELSGILWGSVFSSPLQRCHRLAQDLSQGLPIIRDTRLQELDFGEWEGRLWNDIHPSESQAWTEDFVRLSPPAGESYQQLWNRLWDFLEELRRQPPLDPILIVTHSGIIRAVRCWAESIPLREAFTFPLDYGAQWTLQLS